MLQLFGIFFVLLLKHASGSSTEGIYLHIRSDGKLFNLARLKATTKIREVFIRDMLFADAAAVSSHIQEGLQSLMDCFSQACQDFRLTIRQNVTAQDVDDPSTININDYVLDVIHEFTNLGSLFSVMN